MRFFTVSIFLFFFSFVTIQSTLFIWQEEDAMSVAAFQIEEEEDTEVQVERLKDVLDTYQYFYCNLVCAEINDQAYDISNQLKEEEVCLYVPYSPPERINA